MSESKSTKPQWFRLDPDTNSLPLAPNERIVRAIQVSEDSFDAIKTMLEGLVVGIDKLAHGGIVITTLDEFYQVEPGYYIVMKTPLDFDVISEASFLTGYSFEPIDGDVPKAEDEVLYENSEDQSSVPLLVRLPRKKAEKVLAMLKELEGEEETEESDPPAPKEDEEDDE